MITLFIDSSSKVLSVAITSGDKLVFESCITSYSNHSNYLMNEIDRALKTIKMSINDINNIVVLNGPGSFTGIRVGVTVAKTLAWALKKEIYVLSNLKAIKIGIENEVVISVIYDKDDYSYVGIYDDDKETEEYLGVDSGLFKFKNKKITICALDNNNYVKKLTNLLSLDNTVDFKLIKKYDYISLVKYALSCESVNPHLVNPVYLKKIDAEKNNVNKKI